VTTIKATDSQAGALSYSIAGGADASKFVIDPVTGALALTAIPDYENPADAGRNNVLRRHGQGNGCRRQFR
jgi:hypothetical protein